VNFVIVCSQRTGSTLLTQLLDNQNDVLCNGAIFEPGRLPIRWAKGAAIVAELLDLRGKDPQAYLARVFAENQDRESVGFKICPGHNDMMLDKVLLNRGIGKLVLLRQNVLAVYSSAQIARQSGARRSAVAGASESKPPVEFDPNKFLRFWQRYAAYYRAVFERLNADRQNFHLVYYTELNDSRYFDRILTFIGAKPSQGAMDVQNRKQNSSDILSRFSNPLEAEAFLRKYRLTGWVFETETFLDPHFVL
jgi:hypothetical protein